MTGRELRARRKEPPGAAGNDKGLSQDGGSGDEGRGKRLVRELGQNVVRECHQQREREGCGGDSSGR